MNFKHKAAKILTGFIPFAALWKWQRNILRKYNSRNLEDYLRRLHPWNLPKTLLERPQPSWAEVLSLTDQVRDLLATVRPYDAIGAQKTRIGGSGDGGYVMLDPGTKGIAYSFGVSDSSPWDLDMAERGFSVHQFDGTIQSPPDFHPNMSFHKYNIGFASGTAPDSLNLEQVIALLGHGDERDIILQMDIEGSEWDLLEHIDGGQMGRFRQLVVEFHDLSPKSPAFDRYLGILRKINETHTCIHVHCNNCAAEFGILPGMTPFSSLFEISYARKSDYRFSPSQDSYPTALDMPNSTQNWDLKIGNFNQAIKGGGATLDPR